MGLLKKYFFKYIMHDCTKNRTKSSDFKGLKDLVFSLTIQIILKLFVDRNKKPNYHVYINRGGEGVGAAGGFLF